MCGGGTHLDLGRLEGNHVGDGGGDAGHFDEGDVLWEGGGAAEWRRCSRRRFVASLFVVEWILSVDQSLGFGFRVFS